MKLLVCGTRGKSYNKDLVSEKLSQIYWNKHAMHPRGVPFEFIIIEGCCPESADVIAEEWATGREGVEIMHFPANTGNYLKRNVEMVTLATQVIAFWDGWSYGTAHTIARAAAKRIPITIIKV